MLETELLHLLGCRAQEDHAFGVTASGKIGVFAQEAVAGVDGAGTALADYLEQFVLIQVSGRCRAVSQGIRLVRLTHMQRIGIRFGVDGNRGQTHVPQGANNPAGDSAAVGDQDL